MYTRPIPYFRKYTIAKADENARNPSYRGPIWRSTPRFPSGAPQGQPQLVVRDWGMTGNNPTIGRRTPTPSPRVTESGTYDYSKAVEVLNDVQS
jgi:hypothetical protein